MALRLVRALVGCSEVVTALTWAGGMALGLVGPKVSALGPGWGVLWAALVARCSVLVLALWLELPRGLWSGTRLGGRLVRLWAGQWAGD